MKTEQLQIRVSPEIKQAIRKSAKAAKLDMSEWILAKLFPPYLDEFQGLVLELSKRQDSPDRSYTLASINDMLAALPANELSQAVAQAPQTRLGEFESNYLAAMVEYACQQKKVRKPEWVGEVKGLQTPYFASPLLSLRLHLLTNAPAPFRKRNLFIDSSVGNRV